MAFVVAVDGPSGTGKGTVTSAIAKKFNLMYLDTGATYRCVTLKLLNEKIAFTDIEGIKKALKEIKIEFDDGKVFLDGKDVTKEIREEKVANNVSPVSHILEVRLAMVDLQRKMSEGKDVILEGRDIGTNVFPNANIKFYLNASQEERVRRRVKQNKEKGIEMSIEDVEKNIATRDYNDLHSDIGPLKQAEDAIYIDTTNLSIKDVVRIMSKRIKPILRTEKRIEKGYTHRKETTWKKVERKLVKWFLAGLYHIVYRVKKVGIENISGDEGLIICGNHVNYIDAVGIVVLNRRPIRFVGKSDLCRIPIILWLARLFNIIPVKRDSSDMTSIKLCLKGLKEKDAIGIFPEGTRHGMDKQVKFKNGAVFMAYKAHVRIVPVGISGSFKPFTKVVFNYGKPIDILKYKTTDPDWMDTATEEVMKEIVRLTNAKN